MEIDHRWFRMKSKTYNGGVRSSEKDFETLQLGAFATPGLLLAQGPVGLTAESGFIEFPFIEGNFVRRMPIGCDCYALIKLLRNLV
jgi:hypothetical protein